MREIGTAGDVLDIAIQLERTGRRLYETLAKSSKDTRIWDAYTYLADQEGAHERVFISLSDRIGANLPSELSPDRQEMIQGMVEATLLGDKYEGALREEARSDADALKIGIRFEEDSINLYTQLREFVQEPDRDTVDRVIEEERQHLRLLTDILKDTGI